MDLSKLSRGVSPPWDVNVVIEIPQGSTQPVKYEFDKASGALLVDRFLHTAMYYPANYGFVPHTLAMDGDPMDVLVICQSGRRSMNAAHHMLQQGITEVTNVSGGTSVWSMHGLPLEGKRR